MQPTFTDRPAKKLNRAKSIASILLFVIVIGILVYRAAINRPGNPLPVSTAAVTFNPVTTMSPMTRLDKDEKKPGDSLKKSDWYDKALAAVEQAEYEFSKIDSAGTYSTPNRRNNFRFFYDENGFSVQPRTTKIPIGKFDPVKRPDEVEHKDIADWKVKFLLDKKQVGEGEWSVNKNKAEYITDNITVQYLNNKDGMRQNFIVKKPLADSGDLRMNFTVKTSLKQQFSSDRIQFIHPKDGAVLNYDALKVWDANGIALPAQFEKNGSGYSIQVNTDNATYPITIDPLNSIPGIILEGDQANAQYGFSVDGAGDVNNDGYDDIIIGAPYYDNGEVDEGAAFIFTGSPNGIDLSLFTTSKVESNQAGANLGYSVAGAGDVNKDGYDDVIVGAPYYDMGETDEGIATVYRGSVTGVNFGTAYTYQMNQANAHGGWSVDGAGDVNNDGYADIIIGSPNLDVFGPEDGAFTVLFGSATVFTVNAQISFGIDGITLGWSVSTAGDVNGDGYDDVVVGAPHYTTSFLNGGAYGVWYGSATGITTNNRNFFNVALTGVQAGYSVSGGGDINHDGFDDVVVGAPFADNGFTDDGSMIILKGSATGIIGVGNVIGGANNANLGWSVKIAGDLNKDGYADVVAGVPGISGDQLNEGAVFVYMGSSTYFGLPAQRLEGNKTDARLGSSVGAAGDINGDGYDDVVAGAASYSNGQANEGAAYVYYGTGNTSDLTHLGLNPYVEGGGSLIYLGFSVSSAGDLNGDGYSDVIAGGPGYDDLYGAVGALFICYGVPEGLLPGDPVKLVCPVLDARLGYSVSTAGDVNGDGYSDIIGGAPTYNNGVVTGGAAFIYHGSATGVSATPATIVSSNIADAFMGGVVGCAGDVNGDGYSDVIIGSRDYSNEQTMEGAVSIYYGSASGIVAATPTFIESGGAGYKLGAAVGGAGDVNGDGYSDVIVGEPGYGASQEGRALVYYGSATGLNLSPTTIDNAVPASGFGIEVSTAGDVNGDGYTDAMVGAPDLSNGKLLEGGFYVYLGSPAGINSTAATHVESDYVNAHMGRSIASAGDINGDGFGDIVVLSDYFDGLNRVEGIGYVYYGSNTGISTVASALTGTGAENIGADRVGCAGDVNGDGYPDLIFGLWTYGGIRDQQGRFGMVLGLPRNISNNSSVKLESQQAGAQMGYSVANAGDINGDGISDLLVGRPYYDLGESNEGTVVVYSGSPGGLSELTTTLQRNMPDANFGFSVAGAGDVNGDGYADAIIGATGYTNGQSLEGAAFVYYGSQGGLINNPVVLESNQVFAFSGAVVSSAGDINGDGFSDILVGAPFYGNGQALEGAVFVYLGSAAGINPTPAAILEGNQASAAFGISVSSAGDLNGDGFGDIIIGAGNYDDGETDEGAAFVFYGSASGLNTTPAAILEGNQANASFGSSVAGVGDVNGDGFSDVVVGAPSFDNGQTDEGAVFVYHGSAAGIQTTAAALLQVDAANAALGYTVAGAGDVNGDGYADILAGSPHFSNGEASEGAVWIYAGSPTGVGLLAIKKLEVNKAGALFGSSMTGGGDVNGDGFSDIFIGAPQYADGQTDEGAMFGYYGNGVSKSKRNNVDLYNTDLITPVNRTNFTDGSFGAGIFVKSFMGRDKGKMVWETKESYKPFSGTVISKSAEFTGQQSNYTDLGLTGTELKNQIGKEHSPFTKIRVRVKYNPVTAITGQLYGPWRYVPEQVSGISLGALPVDLLRFEAAWQQQGKIAKISFTTENESAIRQYEIEKSTDGSRYNKIGEIAATNRPEAHDYAFIDSNATAAKQYYRLKTIHYSGTPGYSKIELLTSDKAMQVTLYPNPAVDVLNLKISNGTGKLNGQIVNSAGQVVKQLNNLSAANQTIQIRVSDLTAGIYYLRVQGDGEMQSFKFMKQ